MAGAGMSPWRSRPLHGDRTFIVSGPQMAAEEGGPRVLTPETMDVIGLQIKRDHGRVVEKVFVKGRAMVL